MILKKKSGVPKKTAFPQILKEPTAQELKRWYAQELYRRDKKIKELELKNSLLMKTSLVKAQEIEVLQEEIAKLKKQKL